MRMSPLPGVSAGLVVSEKSGRVRTVRLAPDALREVEDWVSRPIVAPPAT